MDAGPPWLLLGIFVRLPKQYPVTHLYSWPGADPDLCVCFMRFLPIGSKKIKVRLNRVLNIQDVKYRIRRCHPFIHCNGNSWSRKIEGKSHIPFPSVGTIRPENQRWVVHSPCEESWVAFFNLRYKLDLHGHPL